MNEIAGMLVSALGQGFIYAPMALGVFLTFSILKTPDLTVEGSFVFGMTACVVVTIAGHPILGLVAGTLAGAAAGLCTGLLQTKLKIEPILSGILTMTGLYTVNYAILGGQSNRYLQYEAKNSLGVAVNKPADTVYKIFQRAFGKDMSSGMTAFLLTMIIVIVTCAVLVTFFRTRNGMAIIATGDNEEMVRSSSINADVSRIGGVMISNAFVAFSGALLCQYQKYADLNCGNGMLVMGLASVIIGLTFFGNHSVTIQAVGVVLGSLLYRIIIQIAYKIDMPSYAVKLLSAVIVVIALVIPWLQKTYKKKGGQPLMSSQLKLTDITKKFEANTVNEKVALDHLNLTVEPGQFVTVLGSNGSGKSTMFNVILGSLFPDEGKVYLGDKDITKLKDYKRALNIGCLYQNPLRGTAPNLTIEENLALAYTRKASPSFFALNKKDSAYFREVLSTLGMGLEDRMKTKIGLLSGGQRQAASLLMATIAEPELLLLDEHTAALDPGAAEKVMALTKKIVEENKITTLMITHDMEYALEYGSRTIMLDSGKIVMDLTGKEREEMTTGKLAELFYGKAHKRG